jgi:hypothetical protein
VATRFDNTLQCTNSTDALFRAWCQFIHDTLITTDGWVDPGDTGQLSIAAAAHPTLANTVVGYRIYRMNDTLQGSAPVFIRVDYGSGTAANTPQITVTIGTGTNGAGTITGNVGNMVVTSFSSGTNASNSYASADAGRLQLLMFVRAGQPEMLCCSLERTKDATGADTGVGLLLTYGDGGGSVSAVRLTKFLIRAGGSQPPAEVGISFVLSNQSVATAFGGDVGVGIPIHFRGVAQQPGVGMMFVNQLDFADQATISYPIYGATRTYQCGGTGSQVWKTDGNGAAGIRTNTRVAIRYD